MNESWWWCETTDEFFMVSTGDTSVNGSWYLFLDEAVNESWWWCSDTGEWYYVRTGETSLRVTTWV